MNTEEQPDKRRIILVADDEDIVYDILSLSLEDKYQTLRAKSGEEAIKIIDDRMLSGKGLDFVLSDGTMPPLSGREVAAHVSKTYPNLPVALYTGEAERYSDVQRLEIGRAHV